MKKQYITPLNRVKTFDTAFHLLVSSFNDDGGSVEIDAEGSYHGSDALSREKSKGSIWDKGW